MAEPPADLATPQRAEEHARIQNDLEEEPPALPAAEPPAESQAEPPAEVQAEAPAVSLAEEPAELPADTEEKGNNQNKLLEFLVEKKGHPLVAWHHCFDPNGDGRVDLSEFSGGMLYLGYEGDIGKLFGDLDDDNSGWLSLEELDPWSSELWCVFRRWSAQTFNSAHDMCVRLGEISIRQAAATAKVSLTNPNAAALQRQLSRNASGIALFNQEQFQDNASRLGWHGGNESLLFRCLDNREQGKVTPDMLQWFEVAHRWHVKRSKLKAKGKRSMLAGRSSKAGTVRALESFKLFLYQRFGCLFRAWRKVLDKDGSMAVQRKELFKACSDLMWHGNVDLLWHALDDDDSGFSSIEELACSEARDLASFKRWAETTHENVKGAFKQLLRSGRCKGGKLDFDGWLLACRKLECPFNVRETFELLDWQEAGFVKWADMKCVDKWVPEEWLCAGPNLEYAEEFKRQLFHRYGHRLKAWKLLLDRDCTGQASWGEFKHASEKLGLRGDIAGAWAVLDVRNQGKIGFEQIDPAGAKSLAAFKRWAYTRFGGVMLAFQVLDSDGSDSLSLREFRKAVRDHSFKGNVDTLFQTLNTDGDGQISQHEATFLDEWEVDLNAHEGDAQDAIAIYRNHSHDGLQGSANESASAKAPVPTSHRPRRSLRRGLPNSWQPSPGRELQEGDRLAAGDSTMSGTTAKAGTSTMSTSSVSGKHLLHIIGWQSCGQCDQSSLSGGNSLVLAGGRAWGEEAYGGAGTRLSPASAAQLAMADSKTSLFSSAHLSQTNQEVLARVAPGKQSSSAGFQSTAAAHSPKNKRRQPAYFGGTLYRADKGRGAFALQSAWARAGGVHGCSASTSSRAHLGVFKKPCLGAEASTAYTSRAASTFTSGLGVMKKLQPLPPKTARGAMAMRSGVAMTAELSSEEELAVQGDGDDELQRTMSEAFWPLGQRDGSSSAADGGLDFMPVQPS